MLTKPVFGRVGLCSVVFHLLFLIEHGEWRDVKEHSLSAVSRISGRKPVGLYVELNSFLILFVTRLKNPQQTNQTKQPSILDISYPICLFGCLQFFRGIKPLNMLLVLNIFISKETIYKIKSFIFDS